MCARVSRVKKTWDMTSRVRGKLFLLLIVQMLKRNKKGILLWEKASLSYGYSNSLISAKETKKKV
jgi:hypothetical protein